MTTNIEDLLKQNKAANGDPSASSGQVDSESTEDEHDLALASDTKQSQLKAKMAELSRRDLELETLNKARGLSLGYLSMQGVTVDPEILQLVAEHEAVTKKVVCFYYVPYQEMRLASPVPESADIQEIKQRLAERHHTPVKIYLISQDSYQEVIDQYKKLPHFRPTKTKVDMTAKDLKRFEDVQTLTDLSESLKHINTSELLNVVIAVALQLNASDVHVESEEKSVELRYRIDGILQDAASLEQAMYKPIASRIKLLSGIKLNVISRPQDGHFVIAMPEGKVDVRVSTLPTNYGESIVMRILRSDISRLKLEDLGLGKYNFDILAKEIKKPNGMLIVTGPTGSGKTTSLYAILGKLNTKDIKILTIEDPIEYEIKGINQSQINPEAKYTFSVGLRSLVRQDPDIILVGEMRDEETVTISINAALTGHLVLSTIHTNDAAGAIPRFLAMGAKPYLLAPALNTIVAQRLIRILCQHCKQETKLDPETQSRVELLIEQLPDKAKQGLPSQLKFYTAPGCDKCHKLAFKGRIGIFEIFVMSPKLEDTILTGQMSSLEIKKLLKEQGMLTMAQDGILKALAGLTSVEEVFRVTQDQ
jgi:type II secretory ATPase GspE/PulE/Tfp pilus assembly ATPase PilB-like protein